ncbi:hypothetical protein GA0116948_10142 [Chitinophaga costaii]|uniref:DUF1508 domain-containing protein n=1 Tax=Chitinophaga costaii TaxID=1335309 RepID=A0A1C3YQB1_9BACT|nr:YegP family protein [Chitinophaga costaii]SCB72269.1 hypothetical protein GA0116948_10142 [Chitinophaga costaii]
MILTSEGYIAKSSCKNGIESVRKNAPLDERYERKTSTNGKDYFVLKAANGEVIGTSHLYESAQGRDTGIVSVKKMHLGRIWRSKPVVEFKKYGCKN